MVASVSGIREVYYVSHNENAAVVVVVSTQLLSCTFVYIIVPVSYTHLDVYKRQGLS